MRAIISSARQLLRWEYVFSFLIVLWLLYVGLTSLGLFPFDTHYVVPLFSWALWISFIVWGMQKIWRLTRRRGGWSIVGRWMWKIAGVLVGLVMIAALVGAAFKRYERAQDLYVLQKWILVTSGGGESPLEIARWQTRSRCEADLQFVGRAYLDRGVAVTLRCVPVNSLWQFILPRELWLLVIGAGVFFLVMGLALASSGYDWGGRVLLTFGSSR